MGKAKDSMRAVKMDQGKKQIAIIGAVSMLGDHTLYAVNKKLTVLP
jgi:hypothetical protein